VSETPTSAGLDEDSGLHPFELLDAWEVLSTADRLEGFRLLGRHDAEDFFLGLDTEDQLELMLAMMAADRRSWMRLLPPDDAVDLVQAAPAPEREGLLQLLDDQSRREVTALLAYAEDEAAGLMTPRYARVRPDMSVDEALSYLRKQARERVETLSYAYALDADQKLTGVISVRQLFASPVEKKVRDVMETKVISVREDEDQESVSRLLKANTLMAIPVVDGEGRMKGIVTLDDIVDVVEEEATEDIQKMGGMKALDEPYLKIGLLQMIRARGVWLAVLLLGEMLTATAMSYFEHHIARAVVLALFVPLIISSGGNSGSQACTLVIRAMALGEVRLRDWWRVMRRELLAGAGLGVLLGVIGFLRIVVWEAIVHAYGEHYVRVALVVGCSLVGVVLFGTLAGSMLPFLLRRVGLDPASASAPLVATLVDVAGLLLYFSVAALILTGTML
jgi:magnesium transporter